MTMLFVIKLITSKMADAVLEGKQEQFNADDNIIDAKDTKDEDNENEEPNNEKTI